MKPIKKKHKLLKIAGLFIGALVAIFVLILLAGFLRSTFYKNSLHLNGTGSTKLGIVRDNTLNQPGVSNFDIQASNSSALSLINDINRLHPINLGPGGFTDCPFDDGVTYTLKFTSPDVTATFPAYGCQFITIDNVSYGSSTKFLNDITNATHQPYDPDTILK